MGEKYTSYSYPRELKGAWLKNDKVLTSGWKLQDNIDAMKDAVKTCNARKMLGETEAWGRAIRDIWSEIEKSELTPAQRESVRNQVMQMHQEVFRLMHGTKGFATVCVCKRK